MTKGNLAEKIKGMYDLITNRALYVNSNLDVIIGEHELVALDRGGHTKIQLPSEEAYNSTLLFSLLVGLTDHGSLLLVGPPGCGKTTSAEYVGHFVHNIPLNDILVGEIQGHQEQTEEKMVARFNLADLLKEGVETVNKRKFFKTPVKIIDEFTRLLPKAWAVLTRILDTGIATYGNEVLKCEPGPLYATTNYKDDGNYTMTPSTKDRFDLAVMVNEPNAPDFEFISQRGDTKLGTDLNETLELPEDLQLTEADRQQIKEEIANMPFNADARNFMYYFIAHVNFCDGASDEIARKTKGTTWQKRHSALIEDSHYSDSNLVCNLTENGVSTRTMQAIERYSKALAWFRGNEEVTSEDVKTILPYATWHKIDPTTHAIDMNPKFTNDRIGMMKAVAEKAVSQYRGAMQVFEHYGEGLEAAQRYADKEIGKEEAQQGIAAAIRSMAEDDDPVKYSLAVQLTSIYHNLNQG